MKVWLEVLSGARVENIIHLQVDQKRTLGRTRDSDESFDDDDRMSRTHFSLLTNNSGCFLEDLKSSNGTKVNDKRVMSVALEHGDIIQAGKTKFKVNIQGGNKELAESLFKSSGRKVTKGDILVLAKLGQLRVKYQAERGESGLSLLRGEFVKEFAPDEDLSPGALVKGISVKKTCWMLLDPHRLPEPPPDPDEAQSQRVVDGDTIPPQFPHGTKGLQPIIDPVYLFDWLGPVVAKAMSPVILRVTLENEPLWKPYIEAGWGNDAVVVMFTKDEKFDIVAHLRSIARAHDSIVGICWPSVLAPMLLFSKSDITKRFMQGIESVLVELPDLPETWQIVGGEGIEQEFQKQLGFVPKVPAGSNQETAKSLGNAIQPNT